MFTKNVCQNTLPFQNYLRKKLFILVHMHVKLSVEFSSTSNTNIYVFKLFFRNKNNLFSIGIKRPILKSSSK